MKSQDQNTMSSNKATFIAVLLCVVFYLGWNKYLQVKYPGFGEKKTTTSSPASEVPAGADSKSSLAPMTASPVTKVTSQDAPAAPKMNPADLSYDSKDIQFQFSQELGSPVSIKLKNYRNHNAQDSEVVELLQRPATVQAYVDRSPDRTEVLPFTGERTGDGYKFSRVDGEWRVSQVWKLPTEGYVGKVTLTYENLSASPKNLSSVVLTEFGAPLHASSSSFFAPGQPSDKPHFLQQIGGTDEFVVLEEFCKDQSKTILQANQKLDFWGFDQHYFLFAMIPQQVATYKTKYSGGGNPAGSLCEVVTSSVADLGQVLASGSATLNYDVWFGPKEVELLTAFNPRLKTTLGLGWLDMIAHPLLLAIKGLYKFLGNYGLAIIVLTFLLKILFFPLTKQAAASAARMKKLNPEMTRIRERYKGDQQKMQMELMKFMSTHKINPMKGCLPILPTIPVFFALFRVLSASIDLRHAPFFGWITDLSSKDPYYITPILLTVCMFIQQKLTPMTGMDKTQERVMMFMPLIFGVMMITLPSGLVLYMLTNTIVSIVQQQYLNRKFANI